MARWVKSLANIHGLPMYTALPQWQMSQVLLREVLVWEWVPCKRRSSRLHRPGCRRRTAPRPPQCRSHTLSASAPPASATKEFVSETMTAHYHITGISKVEEECHGDGPPLTATKAVCQPTSRCSSHPPTTDISAAEQTHCTHVHTYATEDNYIQTHFSWLVPAI